MHFAVFSAMWANDGKYKEIPIIALTASAMVEIKEQAFEAGMTDYISKPFSPDTLYEKIAHYSKFNKIGLKEC